MHRAVWLASMARGNIHVCQGGTEADRQGFYQRLCAQGWLARVAPGTTPD
jgi:hypothetical protein